MRKLLLPGEAAVRAAWLAASARCFCGLALGGIHNGAWLSALLGGLLAHGLVRAAELRGVREGAPTLILMILAVALLSEALYAAHALDGSAAFLALEPGSALLTRLLLALALGWTVSRGGAGVLYGAMLWVRLMPLLFLPALLTQLPHFRPGWLFPLLGEGVPMILRGGVRAAGELALPFLAVSALAEEPAKREVGFNSLTAGLFAALLLILRLMMAPTLPGASARSWLNDLDALITNGRAPLYLQLPMIVLWTLALMNAAAFHALGVSACLQRLRPDWDGRACAALVGAALLAGLFLERTSAVIGGRRAALPLVACAAATLFGPGRRKAHA